MSSKIAGKFLYVPKDTIPLLEELCSDNDYLSFHRYVMKSEEVKNNRKGEQFKPFQIPCRKDMDIRKQMLNRQRELQSLAIRAFENVLKFQLDFKDKLMVSVGGNSIYSNLAITVLHPLYGHPYIPSSALKGVVRHCWIHEKFEGNQKKALQDPLFVKCFGKADGQDESVIESQGGVLIFFDGILAEKEYKLVEEVVTPHYSEYYNTKGEKEPTDDQKLNILNIRVLKDSSFIINIAISDLFLEEELFVVKKIIKIAFEDYGLGAKTAVGYGLGTIQNL